MALYDGFFRLTTIFDISVAVCGHAGLTEPAQGSCGVPRALFGLTILYFMHQSTVKHQRSCNKNQIYLKEIKAFQVVGFENLIKQRDETRDAGLMSNQKISTLTTTTTTTTTE